MSSRNVDLDKFRLRRFVERLVDMGEVEIHDEPVPLTGLGAIIEGTDKALLFKRAGPEQLEIVAKAAGSRKRLAAAFETGEDKLHEEYFRRLANPQPVVEVPSHEAPVHEVQITGKDVDLTKLPFHPQHAYDGSCYLSSAIDYTIDPATGRRNVGCRRLSLRNRYETGTNVTAPSDLDKRGRPNNREMRPGAEAMKIVKAGVSEPVAVYLRSVSGGSNTLRVSIKQRVIGEARAAIAALFGGIMRLKHIYVFDEDIDIHDDRQVEWALGTRFQADQDLVILQGMLGMTMDPSLNGRRTGAKTGFDCTKPFGRDGEIPLTRSAAKVFSGPARFQTVEQALASAPMFYADIVEAIGSDDGREIACGLDELRQAGRLGRDRDGRYHLVRSKPGVTAIVGSFYHDPNEGT